MAAAETHPTLRGQMSFSQTLVLHLILTVETQSVMYFAQIEEGRGEDRAQPVLGLALQSPAPFASHNKY